MPFIPAPGVAQVNIRARYLDIPMENVLSFTTGEDPATPSVLLDLVSQMASSWTANIMPNISNRYILTEIHARDLSIQAGAIATDTTVAGQAGAQAGAALPGNVAFCVSLRTGLAGRSFRGRTYFAGLTEPEVTENELNPIRAAAFVDGLDGVRLDLLSGGFQLVIVSRQFNNVPRTTAVSTPVSAVLSIDNIVDTQRRRLH
jgi:hypothetical protein